MIHGYPAPAGVAPGESLVLHISTDAARFRVLFYRWGERLLLVHETSWLAGKYALPQSAADDWQWPPYEFKIPHHWPSAVYIAHLEESGGGRIDLANKSASALFIVSGKRRSKLLYKIPLATYHAYNCTGGGCFYINPPRSQDPAGAKLSLHRPGGGIGGETWGALDYYDMSSPRQTFAHWDARFIRWLLRNGYSPEFCTDFDIHADRDLCNRYRLLLSVGHDEYWSEPARDRVEDFVSKGGNVAFFGANLCWWRIHVVDDGTAIVCHQGGPHGAFDHWWPQTGAARPEDALTGVSYRNGGGWWDGPRHTEGFIVQDPEHWVFAGTGLSHGNSFGSNTSPPLVGYECDGAPLESFDGTAGLAVLSSNAHLTGTPSGFRVLAASLLDGDWQERPPREMYPAGAGIHAATMGIFARNGTVFTAGTTDWAQVLENAQDPHVDKITRNVINRLLDK
ncbi:N,N-dimethylformamidase beta subunit family domain-containing protein [Nitrosospira sp. Is2]|uniref:N,N-dimethylformamidase beta subunit family domain-containing protein n=1 Tax=Nitrosospira sp. Is2 TaxID=3080532 RepID=UPI0029559FC5|nr:N,N-dimethylformamidase beta subunit family domain-containing protein [Nitrosospira sp. Is2]WON72767.1 DUF6605 domain-containing protein [Nitrosospira sp. Is2]